MSKNIWRGAALALGAITACVSNGTTGTVWGAWIAPALLLSFVMTTRAWAGFITMVGVWSVASSVMFRGALPVGESEFIALTMLGGVTSAGPYLLHRVAAPQLGRFAGTFVFPVVATGLAFMSSLGSPFGTWGQEAYTQLDFAPLAQIASIGGIWCITFLIGWWASVVAALLTSPAPRPLAAPALFGLCLAGILVFGMARPQLSSDDADKVRVAAVSNLAGIPDKFFEGCKSRKDLA